MTFVTSRPAIKARLLPRYPASVEATAPITASLANGKLSLGYDAAPLADGAPVDPATARVVFREGSVYKEASVSDILASTPPMPAQTVKGNALSSTAAIADVGFATLGNAIGLGIARATIASLSIPVNAITVAGYATVGDYGAGATYVRGTSTGLMAIQDAGGNWWNLALSGFAWAGWFGATGDGLTNDTVALQAANDAIETRGGGFLLLKTGAYAVSQLLLGSAVIVKGQGPRSTSIYGLYNQPATGPVVEWRKARNFINGRVTTAKALVAATPVDVALKDVTAFAAGQAVTFYTRRDLYVVATINSVNTGASTINVTPQAGLGASTVTMTIATPAVVTWNSHGLRPDDPIVFTTTGSLPTGVTAGTVYYVISAGLATNTFRFSATQGGAAVNTSGGQSGTHTATKALAVGDMCWNISDAGSQFAGLEDLYIQGSRDLVQGLQNICAPQARVGAGNLTLNGSAVWADGVARSAFRHSSRIRIDATGDNRAVTFTVNGWRFAKNGDRVAVSVGITGPQGSTAPAVSAGAGKPVYVPNLIDEVTSISTSGSTVGNVFIGFCSLGDGAGVLTWGPGVRLHNVFVQKCRGWGVQYDWIYPVVGYTSPLAAPLDDISYVQSYLNDGGGIDFATYVDADIAHLTVNQCENQCLAVRYFAAGANIRAGHFSAGYENSIRFQRPFETVYVEADTALLSELAIEGGSNGNLVVLGNNPRFNKVRVFDPLSSPDVGGGAWVANPQTTSPYNATGVVLGDATFGWAVTKAEGQIKTSNVAGGHLVMASDGGENVIEVEARDQYTVLTAGATGGVTTVLSVAAIPTKIKIGQTIYIRLDSGTWDAKVIQAFDPALLTITLTTAVSGNAASGNEVVKGLAISGSLLTSGSLDYMSRVAINGRGTNNNAYRFNWYATQSTFPTDTFTGNALIIQGRPSDGQGALIFGDGSGTGGLTGNTRASAYADSLAFRMVAATGLGAQIRTNGATNALTMDTNGNTVSGGRLGMKPAVVVNAASATVGVADAVVKVTYAAGTCTLTLPAAATYPGHVIMVKTTVAQTTVSASSNVVPRAGGAAGTAILAAAAGNWAMLVSDGTNWEVQAGT